MQTTTYMYDCIETNALNSYSLVDYISKHSLSVVDVENGVVLPYKYSPKPIWGLGGVLQQNDMFLEESSYSFNEDKIFGGKYEYDVSKTISCYDTVVYMGHVISHWGSFLLS